MVTQFDKAGNRRFYGIYVISHLGDFYWRRLFALINVGIVLDLIKNEFDLLIFLAHNPLSYGHRACWGIVIWWRLTGIFIVAWEKQGKQRALSIFSQIKHERKMENKRSTRVIVLCTRSKQFSFQILNTPRRRRKRCCREEARKTKNRRASLWVIKYFPHAVCITCIIYLCVDIYLYAYPRRTYGARPEQLPLHTSITPLAVPIISRL